METSIRDVFLSMQLPPVDEIVANSKTGHYQRISLVKKNVKIQF